MADLLGVIGFTREPVIPFFLCAVDCCRGYSITRQSWVVITGVAEMESLSGESASGAGVYWALLVALMAAVFLAGCDARSEAGQQMPAPEVDVARVIAEPVTLWESCLEVWSGKTWSGARCWPSPTASSLTLKPRPRFMS